MFFTCQELHSNGKTYSVKCSHYSWYHITDWLEPLNFMLFHYRSHCNLYTFFFSNQKQLKILNTWKQNGYHQDKMLHSKPRIRDHLMCQPSLHVACGKNKLAFALWIPGKKQQEYTLASAIKNGSMEGDFWTFVHPSWTGVTADSVFPFQIVNIKRSH